MFLNIVIYVPNTVSNFVKMSHFLQLSHNLSLNGLRQWSDFLIYAKFEGGRNIVYNKVNVLFFFFLVFCGALCQSSGQCMFLLQLQWVTAATKYDETNKIDVRFSEFLQDQQPTLMIYNNNKKVIFPVEIAYFPQQLLHHLR